MKRIKDFKIKAAQEMIEIQEAYKADLNEKEEQQNKDKQKPDYQEKIKSQKKKLTRKYTIVNEEFVLKDQPVHGLKRKSLWKNGKTQHKEMDFSSFENDTSSLENRVTTAQRIEE